MKQNFKYKQLYAIISFSFQIERRVQEILHCSNNVSFFEWVFSSGAKIN